MPKLFLSIGAFLIFYTVIAKITGIPEIADYIPMDWRFFLFGERLFKVVPVSGPSYSWLYTIGVGGIFVLIGVLIRYFKKVKK